MNDFYSLTPSQIVMYTTKECSDCLRVKAFFDANHFTFLQIGLEGDERAMEFVAEINHGYHRVPTIVFPDGTVLCEPTWKELREKLKS